MHPTRNPTAVIYDDHLLFSESFSSVIERLTFFKSVHTFDEEQAYRRFLIKYFDEPFYLFLDYYLPKKNALTLIQETRRINKKARVIIVSSVTDPVVINHILTYDPAGFLSKSCGIDTVIECLRTIALNKLYICPSVQKIVDTTPPSGTVPFTARELEILQYFDRGLSIVATAEVTHLSKHTIVSHRRNMMAKSRSKSIIELLTYARKHHLLD
ncbi:response regulator transcription factor [Parapedobacter soli]|uniref:response regulator transcription factor n=1 Tax=Parapedobacter soli TaxID=416955 RepID=UPI0021C7F1E4|nr:response regulator transcription factor [Parapedobacter soli]